MRTGQKPSSGRLRHVPQEESTLDWHRGAGIPDIVGAAQKRPGDPVTLQAAVPEAKHADGEAAARRKAKPTAGWELPPFLSDLWPHLSELQLPHLWNTPNPVFAQSNPEQ